MISVGRRRQIVAINIKVKISSKWLVIGLEIILDHILVQVTELRPNMIK